MELVVGSSEATMKSLLGKLGGLLAEEYTLIRGVRGDIQYISDELTTMQAFLRDLSSAPDWQDSRMKDWMKQIRDIAYDCEDCIDDFAHRLPNEPFSNARCSFIMTRIYELWTWWPRREIASRIGELKVRAQQISERRSRYGVNNPDHRIGDNSGMHESVHDIAEYQLADRQLIGIKEPVGMTIHMKELEEWVNKRDGEQVGFAVLSIVGFGGVGKTTIAMALYWKFRNEFQCRASVTVSQNYDEAAVLRSILKQVMPQDIDHKQQGCQTLITEEKNLVSQIRNKLKRIVPQIRNRQQGNDGSSDVKPINIETMNHNELLDGLKLLLADKRYLLLIDDIWSVKTWESIRHCLPAENDKGSRIIVTSRFQAVGATCSPRDGIDYLHTVDFLTAADSKILFNRSVSESKSSKVEKQVPENILQICGGLPLVIVSMAGLVACNPSKHTADWDKICKSLFPAQVTSLTLDGVANILNFCYNDMPADLKTCSLYLSIFPKGYKISRKRLTRRWIAEGFVSEKQGLTEEEVAETCFNQLARRKIIRPVEHNSSGKIKTFQVHDMVLQYIVSKSSEENFITVIGGHWMMPAPSNKVRRLSMQSSGSKHGNSTKGMNLSQVRSLTVFGSLSHVPFHSFNSAIIQVLDLEGWKALKEKHLDDICKMLVLKYLSLRRTEVAKIPSKIGRLEYLETLDIRETKVEELPKSVGQLKLISSILGGNKKQRKGLRLPQEKSKDPKKSVLLPEKGNEGMKTLRVLSGIEIVGESTAIAGLHQLTGLKKLAIYRLSIGKDGDTFKELCSSIEYLCSCGLQTLVINDEGADFINSLDKMRAVPRYLITLELLGKLESPPKWITELHALNKLTLPVTVLRTRTLELLNNLKSLFSLTFSLDAAEQDGSIRNIIQENKSETYGEVFVPGGFKGLKLLCFFSPCVPKLGFSDNAMPDLEMIEMRFEAFEGLFGIDTLEKLQEVHVRVNAQAAGTEKDITDMLLDDLKNSTEGLRVIVDRNVSA